MPSLDLRPIIVLVLSGLLMSTASATPTIGGQTVLIDRPGFTQPSLLLDATAASDGTLFVACHGDPGLDLLNIYRSQDGGTTWVLWDQLTTGYVDGRVHQAALTTIDDDPDRLLVAWIDQRLDAPFSTLKVWAAEVTAEVPSWSGAVVALASGWTMHDPQLDSFPWLGGLSRVALAWRQDDDTVRFAGSYDSGDSWSPAVVVGSADPDAPIQAVDVSLDNLDVVHLAWVTIDAGLDITSVHYNRAEDGGLDTGDWAGEENIYAVSGQEMIDVTIAADPGLGDEVVIAAGGEYGSLTPLRVLTSVDSGATWPPAVLFAFHSHPDLAWGAAGPVMAADTVDPDVLGGGAWSVMTRTGSSWSSAPMVQHAGEGSRLPGAALALDPSRDDQPLVVGLRTLLGAIDEYAPWFNAAWRDAPGYGVPDPHDAHRTSGRAITRPVLAADLNGDGTQEVVLVEESVTGSDRLWVYDPENDTYPYSNFDVHPDSEVALIDIDGDGDREIFWIRESDLYLEGRRGGGNSLPGFPVDLDLDDGPFWISGARVAGNPGEDVVVAGSSTVHMVGQGGEEPPGWPWIAPHDAGLNYGRVALGDVDGDGYRDLVIPMTGRVAILDRLGQTMTNFGAGEAAPTSPSLADLDDDGDLEIAIPRLDGTIHLVHHDGTTVSPNWPYDTGNNGLPSQVALADIAGDERRDLVFMDHAHVVHAVTPAGNLALRREADLESGSPVVEPLVVKVGPEEVTIAVGAADGIMRVIGLDGRQEGWPRNMAAPILAAAAVADLDADGFLEMVVPTVENLLVLDMGVAPSDSLDLWPMSGFDPGRTGCVETPADVMSAVPDLATVAATLHGASPNPFNPMTTIRFSLDADARQASLRVYDLAGRLVITLLEGPVPAGEHAIAWRGIDDTGRAMPSGVYLCRLVTGGGTVARSMALVR